MIIRIEEHEKCEIMILQPTNADESFVFERFGRQARNLTAVIKASPSPIYPALEVKRRKE